MKENGLKLSTKIASKHRDSRDMRKINGKRIGHAKQMNRKETATEGEC